jgi:hypothetical protein
MYLIAQQVNTAATSIAFGTYVVRIQSEISCHASSPRPASLLQGKYKDSSSFSTVPLCSSDFTLLNLKSRCSTINHCVHV